MELRDFIKETIIQITDGIIEGNEYIVKNDFGSGVSDSKGKEVNFDIAVNTDEEEKQVLQEKNLLPVFLILELIRKRFQNYPILTEYSSEYFFT